MKLINGHRYQGTADIPFMSWGIIAPETMGEKTLTEFGFVDVVVTTRRPDLWPEEHAHADIFASGTWGKPTGEYEIPEFVTWIYDVTPNAAKEYAAGPHWVVLSPTSVLGVDAKERAAFEQWLGVQQVSGLIGDLKIVDHDNGITGGGSEVAYLFRFTRPQAWMWKSERTSLPTPGVPSKYEWEPTPGQKKYIDSSKDAFEDALKSALMAVAGVGIGLIVLNAVLSRRRA